MAEPSPRERATRVSVRPPTPPEPRVAAPDLVSARRERSRTTLLRALAAGAATRAELTATTGLSRSAVSAAVTDLLTAGFIAEDSPVGRSTGGRGRRSSPLRLRSRPGFVLGIDFGHTHVRTVLADTDARVVDERTASVDVDGAATVALDTAAELVRAMLDDAQLDRSQVLGTAAGIPGPLDREKQAVTSPTILNSWVTLNTADELARRLGVAVHVENDADMGAIGEHRFGAARHFRHFLYIKASHGIGASLFLGGECYRGAIGIAGEIGHTRLAGATNRCRCGNLGCLESAISVGEVRAQLANTHLRHDDLTGTPTLTDAAADPVGARVFTDAGRMVGMTVADGCNWLNPEAVVLGGELGVTGKPFADGVREAIARYSQPAAAESVQVLTAELGARAEVMGAVAAAIDQARMFST